MAPKKKTSPFRGEVRKMGAYSNSPEEKLRETDPATLTRRQKQIDYGKTTNGYANYIAATPKEKRTSKQPRTPDKHQICSRRSWDGQIKLWRLLLHAYDDDRLNSSGGSADSSQMSSSAAEEYQGISGDSSFVDSLLE